MTDRPDDNASTKPKPAPAGPPNLLDSIFRDGGPLPPAKLGIRAIAFGLDFAMLFAFAVLVIVKFSLPAAYPGATTEFKDWLHETWQLAEDSVEQGVPMGQVSPPPMSPFLQEAVGFGWEVALLIFWAYFAIGETYFKGSSLGKRACRLRSISTVTLGPPPVFAGIVRGGTKTLILFLLFPIGLILTMVALFFNKRRQMAHDLFSRTAVVDEKSVNLPSPS